MVKLGDFIKRKRMQNDMSLRDFASLCDLSHSYVDSLEKGKDPRTNKPVSPTIETLAKLAKGLGMPLRELMDVAASSLEDNDKVAESPVDHKTIDDDDIFEAQLAANMEAEYGQKPSPELIAVAKKVYRSVLKEIAEEEMGKKNKR